MWWKRNSEKPQPPQPPQSLDPDQLGMELWEAAYEGEVQKAETLLDSKADIHYQHQGESGTTPLHIASQNGNLVVKLLLARKADPNMPNQYGFSALHYASARGHQSFVELLLNFNANIDLQGKDGWTPLYTASSHGKAAVVEVLLARNADPTIKNQDGKTARDIAVERGKPDVVKLLDDFQKNNSAYVPSPTSPSLTNPKNSSLASSEAKRAKEELEAAKAEAKAAQAEAKAAREDAKAAREDAKAAREDTKQVVEAAKEEGKAAKEDAKAAREEAKVAKEEANKAVEAAKEEAKIARAEAKAANDAARAAKEEKVVAKASGSKAQVMVNNTSSSKSSDLSGLYDVPSTTSPSHVRIGRAYVAAAREIINYMETDGIKLSLGELNNLKSAVQLNLEQFCYWIKRKSEPRCAVRDGVRKKAIVVHKSDITLLNHLGDGASGVVWKARYAEKLYACKGLLDPKAQDEAQKELKAWGSIPRTPYLAPLVGVVMDKGQIWGFMTRLCDQGSLEGHKRLNKVDVLKAILHSLIGLRQLHEVGLVHRDLARRNLLWNGDRVLLSDFGLTRQSNYIYRTDRTERLPWPAYAPEALHTAFDDPTKSMGVTFTKEVDVWAFGLLMWELATWETPFAAERKRKKDHDFLASIGRGETRLSLQQVASEMPELVGPIIGCIQLKPEDRLTLEQLQLMLEAHMADKDKVEPRLSDEDGVDEYF